MYLLNCAVSTDLAQVMRGDIVPSSEEITEAVSEDRLAVRAILKIKAG